MAKWTLFLKTQTTQIFSNHNNALYIIYLEEALDGNLDFAIPPRELLV